MYDPEDTYVSHERHTVLGSAAPRRGAGTLSGYTDLAKAKAASELLRLRSVFFYKVRLLVKTNRKARLESLDGAFLCLR